MNTENESYTYKLLEILQQERAQTESNIIEFSSLDFKREGVDQDILEGFLDYASFGLGILSCVSGAGIGVNSKDGSLEIVPNHALGGIKKDNSYNTYVITINPKKFDIFYKILRRKLEKISSVNGKPVFSETPPQILWGSVEIPIPPETIQLCVCRILFDKKVGEIVSWDVIAEEVDGNDEAETSWRSVYDAVMAVNRKVKEKTGKLIFKAAHKSFFRVE